MSTRKPPTEPHPLFLPENEGDEIQEIGFINVKRLEHGHWIWAQRQYPAGELTSLERLFDLYGGGHYELSARGRDNARITALRRYELAGRPLPLTGEPPPPQSTQLPTQQTDGGIGGLAALIPVLLPVVIDLFKSSAEASRQQAASQTQLMVAMMNRDAENARAHILTMQQLHDRQASSQADLLRAVLERSGGGGGAGGMETFLQAAEVLNQIRAGAVEEAAGGAGGGDSITEFTNGIGAVVEQLGKVKTLTGPDEPPPQQRPRPIAAPPQAPANGQQPPKQPAVAPQAAPPKQQAAQ